MGQKCSVWPETGHPEGPDRQDTLSPASCSRITPVHEECMTNRSKNQVCQGATFEIPVKNNHSLKDVLSMTENPPYHDDTGQLLKILVASEHARADALFRKDRRALESLLAKDFVEINLFGHFSREDFLARILPCSPSIPSTSMIPTSGGPVMIPRRSRTAARKRPPWEGTRRVSALP